MSSSFQGNPNNLLPTNFVIPVDMEQKNIKLREYFNDLATAVNSKDSGIYDAPETITGQQFLPFFSTQTQSSVNYRTVFRKVIDFGSLPNSGSKSVAHGINFQSSFSGTKIYGAATDPNVRWIPLPYSSPTSANAIELYIDATNVVVITGSNRTNFTRCFIIIEYIKVA